MFPKCIGVYKRHQKCFNVMVKRVFSCVVTRFPRVSTGLQEFMGVHKCLRRLTMVQTKRHVLRSFDMSVKRVQRFWGSEVLFRCGQRFYGMFNSGGQF